MSEPFIKPVVSPFRTLINRALGDEVFARELLDPETRVRALRVLGLEGAELEKALEALGRVNLEAIEEFQYAVQPGLAIPI